MNLKLLWGEDNSVVSDHSVEDVLSHHLKKSPAVTINHEDMVWRVASMLPSYLESFSDSLLIMKDGIPIGTIGGREMMAALFFNPSFDLLDDTTVETIGKKRLNMAKKSDSMDSVLYKMQRQRLAFVIVPDDKKYSCISSRSVLEVASKCKTEITVKDIPTKPLVSFRRDSTIKEVFVSMFQNQTRRLILENASLMINDRMIIERIVTKLNYLDGVDNFLEMSMMEFPVKIIKEVSEDVAIPELCKIMLGEESPCVLAKDQVITPWDIVNLLK